MDENIGMLVASFLALIVGPLVYRLVRDRPALRFLFKVVVGLSLIGLIGFHVLPECVAVGGAWAIVAAGAGLVLPSLFERFSFERKHHHHVFVALAVCALALHAFTDGLALVGGHEAHSHGHPHGHGHALGFAVILHRLPVGVLLFWLLRKRHPAFVVWCVGVIVACTTVGFLLGAHAMAHLDASAIAVLQAFLGGTLAHVLLHRHPVLPDPMNEREPHQRRVEDAG